MLDTTHLPHGAKILAAVSGGADSLALLLALHQAQFAVVAAHVNHGLRGAESDGDERCVLELCAAQNIAVSTRRVVCENSSEDAARQARYAALTEMAREHGCALIATGHTADDVVETVLMNWLRGASVAGLAGIPPRRELETPATCGHELGAMIQWKESWSQASVPAVARSATGLKSAAPTAGTEACHHEMHTPAKTGSLRSGLVLVRPLLSVTRSETREFCRAAGWAWREDSSNASPVFTRNRVRALLPMLAEAGGATPEQLARQTARAAGLWREESEFLDELASRQLNLLTLENSPGQLVLNGPRLAALPAALARRLLRMAAKNMSPGARETGSEPVETLRCHIAGAGRHAVWQWPGGVTIEWTGPQSGNRLVMRGPSAGPETSAGLV